MSSPKHTPSSIGDELRSSISSNESAPQITDEPIIFSTDDLPPAQSYTSSSHSGAHSFPGDLNDFLEEDQFSSSALPADKTDILSQQNNAPSSLSPSPKPGQFNTTVGKPSHYNSIAIDDDRFQTAELGQQQGLSQLNEARQKYRQQLLNEQNEQNEQSKQSEQNKQNKQNKQNEQNSQVQTSSQRDRINQQKQQLQIDKKDTPAPSETNTSKAFNGLMSGLASLTSQAMTTVSNYLIETDSGATPNISTNDSRPGDDSDDDADDYNEDDVEADRYHGANAYLSTQNVSSEAPCIYNIIREGKTKIFVDCSHSHMLDCPVSTARTPFSIHSEKLLNYYFRKNRREARRHRRAQKKAQQVIADRRNAVATIQEIEDDYNMVVTYPLDMMTEEETKVGTHDVDHFSSESSMSKNYQIVNPSSPTLTASEPSQISQSNNSDDLEFSLSAQKKQEKEQEKDKPAETETETEPTSTVHSPSTDSFCDIADDHDKQEFIDVDGDKDEEFNDLTLDVSQYSEINETSQNGANVEKDKKDDDSQSQSNLSPIIRTSTSSPRSSQNSLQASPFSQSRSISVNDDSNYQSFTHEDSISLSSSINDHAFDLTPQELPVCTCGGGDDLFSARQCSVDVRSEFITRNFTTLMSPLSRKASKSQPHQDEITPKCLLLKAYNMSWNLFGTLPTTFAHVIPPSCFDLYVISLQECGTVSQSLMGGNTAFLSELLLDAVGSQPDEFTIIASTYLQTIYTFVLIRTQLMPFVHGISKEVVATGYGDFLGNKGGVAVRFFIGPVSICCIGAHFNSGQGQLEKRNQDFHKIAGRLTLGLNDCTLSPAKNTVFPYQQWRSTFRSTSISAHGYSAVPAQYKQFYPHYSDIGSRSDVTFWLGDLNFRVHGSKKSVEDMLAFHRHFALLHLDQLQSEISSETIFHAFREGVIAFPPTYKYDPGQQCYDTSPKQRIPSWTDRILYRDNCTFCCHEHKVCDCTTRPCRYADAPFSLGTFVKEEPSALPAVVSTAPADDKIERVSAEITLPLESLLSPTPSTPSPLIGNVFQDIKVIDPRSDSSSTIQTIQEDETFEANTNQNDTDTNKTTEKQNQTDTHQDDHSDKPRVTILSTDDIVDLATTPTSRLSVSRPSRPTALSLSSHSQSTSNLHQQPLKTNTLLLDVDSTTAPEETFLSPLPYAPAIKKAPNLPPRPERLHQCQRVLLEKYGCVQNAIESDHRPVYAHFLLSLNLGTFSPNDVPKPVFANEQASQRNNYNSNNISTTSNNSNNNNNGKDKSWRRWFG